MNETIAPQCTCRSLGGFNPNCYWATYIQIDKYLAEQREKMMYEKTE